MGLDRGDGFICHVFHLVFGSLLALVAFGPKLLPRQRVDQAEQQLDAVDFEADLSTQDVGGFEPAADPPDIGLGPAAPECRIE